MVQRKQLGQRTAQRRGVASVKSASGGAPVASNAVTSLSGDATDNSGAGLQKVQVSLYYIAGGVTKYWNNGSWGSYGASSLLPVTLGTATGNVTPWSTTALPSTLPPYTLTIRLEVIDNTGGSSGLVTSTFTVTQTPPSGEVSTPANNAEVGPTDVTALSGTATDRSGLGIKRATLNLYYFTGGTANFWTGTGWSTTNTVLTATLGTATGNVTPWSYASLPTGLPPGNYSVKLTVVDNANLTSGALQSTFKVLSAPPTGAISTPANNSAMLPSGLSGISGTATDNNTRGIKKLNLSLYYYSGGAAQFWNGSAWVAGKTLLPVALDTPTGNVTPWHTTASLPGTLVLGQYYLQAVVVDNANASSSVIQGTFKVKQPASLSASGAKAFSGLIKLYFTGPLDLATAQNIANYTVSVGGTPLTVQGASYSSNVVTLQMGAYAYSVGNTVHVAWSGIKDANGLTVSGSTDITAR